MGIDFRRPRHIRGFRLGEVLVWDFTSKSLVERTVSGSVVAFSDGADDVPLKSCEVTIAPTLDGVSSVDVVQGGYNFIDESTAEYGNLNISTGNVDTTSTSWKTTDFMPLFAGDFFFTWVSSSTYFQVKWVAYDSNKTRIDGESTATWTSVYSKQFTFPTGTAFVRFCWSVVVSANPVTREDIRLNRGTVDLGYTEYVEPTTHTASLGRTIYGGEVDVVNGTGTDETRKVDLSTLSWTFSSTRGYFYTDDLKNVILSPSTTSETPDLEAENYTPVSFNNIYDGLTDYSIAINPASNKGRLFVRTDGTNTITPTGYLLYKLETPETFTFTPVPILSRLGDNTLWGDGDLNVTYYAYAN